MDTYGNIKSFFARITKFPSVVVVLLSTGIFIYMFFNVHHYKGEQAIDQDVISYYLYLPAAFIYKDLTLEYFEDAPEKVRIKTWFYTTSNGRRHIKMSSGMAIMYSPFFFIAHAISKISGWPSTGYEPIYAAMIWFSGVFYASWGLWMVRLSLRKYFSELITAITLVLIAFGTNLLCYTFQEGAMSHVASFFLFASLLWLTAKWHEKKSYSSTCLLGLTIGIITIVRPTNIIVCLLPLLYGVWDFKSLKTQLNLFISEYKKVILAGICFLIGVLPQLLYWKFTTGNFIHYSYQSEGFFFNNPKLIDGLFSYRKGWLVYTPIMIFALFGFFTLRKLVRTFTLPLAIILLLQIYIAFSWWTWWYGGSFGQRVMVEYYALLALPLASFCSMVIGRALIIRSAFFVFLVAAIMLNGIQTYQYRKGILHWDSMTKKAYWGIFLKLKYPHGYDKMVKYPDYEKAIKGENEYP